MIKSFEKIIKNLLVMLTLIIMLFFINTRTFAETILESAPMPIWYTNMVVSKCDENYTIQSTSPNYCATDSSVVYNYAEVFAYATDETGEEIMLHHQGNNDLSSSSTVNQNAEGNVSVRIENRVSTTGIYRLSNDGMKIKYLDANLKIKGDNTTIGNGKIFYRAASRSRTDMSGVSWNYINLSDVTLHFTPDQHVQIVIIYEQKENTLIHHHIRIQYFFDTYAV